MNNKKKETNKREVIIGIYKITNPKGRVYIGLTENVLDRWKDYYDFVSSSIRKQPIIYNSLQKYGVENHKFEILCECELHELYQLEIIYKKFYLNKLGGWKQVLFCNIYDKNGPRFNKNVVIPDLNLKGNFKSNSQKRIKQTNSKGEFIHEYDSANQAGRCLGVRGGTNSRLCFWKTINSIWV